MKKPVHPDQSREAARTAAELTKPTSTDPNWDVGCENCGEKPTVGNFGLCGPCCFGEADTAGGNW